VPDARLACSFRATRYGFIVRRIERGEPLAAARALGKMALMPPNSRIVRFYLGSAPDYEGRKIGDIWLWNRSELDASPRAFNPDFRGALQYDNFAAATAVFSWFSHVTCHIVFVSLSFSPRGQIRIVFGEATGQHALRLVNSLLFSSQSPLPLVL
jgi:hypothetical protein